MKIALLHIDALSRSYTRANHLPDVGIDDLPMAQSGTEHMDLIIVYDERHFHVLKSRTGIEGTYPIDELNDVMQLLVAHYG